MVKKFYITTTIPYANAEPHIGFALELIQADILARWNKIKSKNVFFLTGIDEHGQKIVKTAKLNNKTPKIFVDEISEKYKELAKKLNISNDNFIRTTDKDKHWQGVENIWKKLLEKGDIYKKKYKGSYCFGCERFVTEKDLVGGKCPYHPNLDIESISEENYFFKLSKYSDKIKELIKKNKLEIFPEKWKNNFLNSVKKGLQDVSFSRDKKNLSWGIPVPNDKSQVIYVWCDALINYLTGIKYPDKSYKEFWPADIHVVGKDMLRFHAGIWPGMLLSADIELPKKIIVHGFLTVNNKKMSKSLGNVVLPLKLLEKYSEDALRFFFCRNFVFGQDGDFSEKALISRNNNELADKLGNLVSRTTSLIEKKGLKKTQNKLIKKLNIKKIEKLIENYQFDKALNEIFSFIDICNQYIQHNKLWQVKDKQESKKSLYELADSIKAIAILLWPFIPATSEKIAENFDFKIGKKSFDEIKKPLDNKRKIKKEGILFKKIK